MSTETEGEALSDGGLARAIANGNWRYLDGTPVDTHKMMRELADRPKPVGLAGRLGRWLFR